MNQKCHPARAMVLTLVVLVTALACSAPKQKPLSEQEEHAVEAAQAWLELVDQGEYEQSWEMAAEMFRQRLPKNEWSRMVSAGREPLGSLVSRDLESTEYSTTLPGAPDGEYVVIQFAARFENKESAIETVTPMKETDGKWRVSGYFIK